MRLLAAMFRALGLGRRALLFACLACLSANAPAARVAVILSEDSAPYQEIYQVLRVLLGDAGHEVERAYADGLGDATLEQSQLTVSVGVRAAEALARSSSRAPVLAVLVPRGWYAKVGRASLVDGGRRSASAIYVDQPFERQAYLIRLAFPEARRVGVLLGNDQVGLIPELETALAAQQVELVSEKVAPEGRLIAPLESVLGGADLLLAVPDPVVFNRNTAQSIFLTTYRYRVPVLGYSRSLTRAGALLSLHSSPAQVGRQAAEWVNHALQGAAPRLPPPAYPAYFSVSVNDQVAHSLAITLPPETELEKRLGGKR